ncbi:slipin family protein [Streptomyces spectabilis]|uniref:Regulator of protease activity HflC (Stomatin/prohibitin superfamily) n=1 Tax=Streptomyces spectabilis TaxID=68270 RepID=A0A5P2XMD7_STRST|nr:slipin family protein [Streptomyces spectabilis]MBB5105621.1 regulator of protease activity HflC (stomatin/prohibitin superfamily) [Streptomyces spectabilis]MCI3906803.1 SPFH domain-containing protein [Streptomyces spectabilis]QEV63602.1 slipin family protein [Streptomyces spectabilis]GGV22831.1 peptidase [Streptomyces spectabilis]
MGVLITVLAVCAVAGLVLLALSLHNVQQYEKGVVFRFGRLLPDIRGPGLRVIRPIGDRMRKVSVQTEVLGIPPQGSITADNVTLTVDAVVYFKVIDPVKALVNVRDYPAAVSQIAQTSLRSVIGRADLDTLLSDRDHINAELKKVMDAPTEEPWGLRIERVEIKDIALPESMMRSMSKQAEAERERRARVIAADGEFQASQRLTDAAATMADTPGALQLRLLQTVVDVSAEKNSTLVMPFPVEMLRFFEHQSRQGGDSSAESDGRLVRRSDGRAVLSAEAMIPEPAIPALAHARSASLPEELTGSRAEVARERRDNWPTRHDAEEALSG